MVTARSTGGSASRTWSAPMRVNSTSRPGSRAGFSRSHSVMTSCGATSGPSFTPIGFFTPDRNSTCAPSGWRERLFVAEQQGLVRGPVVDLVQLELRVEVDAARGHEPQRAIDLVGEGLVALTLSARRHELLVPRMHAREVGEAALRERACEVQGGRRLV